jgi:ABC-2 type transport system permease protein
MSLRRVLAIARAEWLLNRRDPRSLVVIFVLPVLLLILYGYGLNFDQKNLPIAVQDLDKTELSRDILRRATAAGYFRIAAWVNSDAEMWKLLRSRRALAVVVIPPGFTRTVAAGRQVTLGLVIDGSDSVTASTALGYVEGLVSRMSTEVGREWAQRMGLKAAVLSPIEVRTQVLYNPNLDSAPFVVPGLIGVVMALMAALLTSTCIVREREVGTAEAMLVTPVKVSEVILGKMLPYATLAMVDIGLCIVAGGVMFGVLPRGSVAELFLVSAIFVLACVSIGLAISGWATSQRTAIVGGIMMLMLPTMIISGFVFPVANMPVVLRMVSFMLPATHYLVVARAAYLRAVSVFVFWRDLVVLCGIAGLVFCIAVKTFRGRL